MKTLLTEPQKDRIAALVIRVGGIFVILVVVAIVVNIGFEALPLFRGASAGELEELGPAPTTLAAGTDPRRELVWTLDRDGFVRLDRGDEPIAVIDEDITLIAADHEIHDLVSALSDEGVVVVGRIRFRDEWTADERSTVASWRPAADPFRLPSDTAWVGVTANSDTDGEVVVVAWSAAGRLIVAAWDADEEVWELRPGPVGLGEISAAAVAEDLGSLAVAEGAGRLRIFDLPSLAEAEIDDGPAPTTAVRFLIGGGTLVTGGEDGSVNVLLEVPRVRVENRGAAPLRLAGQTVAPGAAVVLLDDQLGQSLASKPEIELTPSPAIWTSIREMPPMPAAVRAMAPASRRRGIVVGGDDGSVGLFYSTSGRRLLLDRWTDSAIDIVALSPKGDGAVALAGGNLLGRSIDNPHPEISFRTLFLPVWYEGYAAPKWVWQTSGGSDAFEPKMSLWPLIFGTLKATLYALLFSVPMALMAAVYVSQLAPAWLQAVIKPTVELMAAVPSVVVGFLAALWLAPRLEAALFAALVTLMCLPLAVGIAVLVWRAVPVTVRRGAGPGWELGALFVGLASIVALVAVLADPLESWLFNGDFQRFLFTEWGLRFDQRNSIVVGLALGFRGHPGDLHPRRGRLFGGAPEPGLGKSSPRRDPLADRGQARGSGCESGALCRGHARARTRRRRDHDRPHGGGEHADPRSLTLQRDADHVGRHRGGDPRSPGRRHALQGALSDGSAALHFHLFDHHRRRCGGQLPAEKICPLLR